MNTPIQQINMALLQEIVLSITMFHMINIVCLLSYLASLDNKEFYYKQVVLLRKHFFRCFST